MLSARTRNAPAAYCRSAAWRDQAVVADVNRPAPTSETLSRKAIPRYARIMESRALRIEDAPFVLVSTAALLLDLAAEEQVFLQSDAALTRARELVSLAPVLAAAARLSEESLHDLRRAIGHLEGRRGFALGRVTFIPPK